MNQADYDGLSLIVVRYTDPYSPTPEHLVLVVDLTQRQPLWTRLVGGRIEPGETPEQAAWREMKEETGLDVSRSISHRKLGRTEELNKRTGEYFDVYIFEATFELPYLEEALIKVSEESDLVNRVAVAKLPEMIDSFHPRHIRYLELMDSKLHSLLFEHT